MSGGSLRIGSVSFHLHGMDEVWKLHRVLYEEHGDIVAHQVPIALLGIELHRKAADITRCVH